MAKDITRTISAALDATYERALKQEEVDGKHFVDLDQSRLVIFSDHHRGSRDGADDFLVCEQAYAAALTYYDRLGYTLLAMGDVEELWEDWPKATLEAYPHILELESKFHKAGRYIRFWGNHDDAWRHADQVQKWLVPALGVKEGDPPLKVRETLILRFCEKGEEIGQLFLVHGHQGTLDSERFAPISKFLLRYFWRPFQRTLKFSMNTPSKDFDIRFEHENAMYQWSERKEKIVLIAGHTHRPVFKSKSHDPSESITREKKLEEKLKEKEAKLGKLPDKGLQQKVAELAAEVEWVHMKNQQPRAQFVDFLKPSYFNTGCCAFLDGDITGLEISDGEIRLVRWPDDNDMPKPKVLETAKLKDVFKDCM